MDAKSIRSAVFWDDTNCSVAGDPYGLADIHVAGGCVLFLTSGSTGGGKCIVLGKIGLLVSARAVNAWLGVDAKSVWGLALPIDHVGGFGVVARAYVADCGLSVYDGKWDAGGFVESMARERVTHVSLVPTQLHDLVEAELRAPESLKAVVIGGGRLSETLGQAARDLGWPVLASYGMTEAGSQIATQRMEDLGKPFSEGLMELLPIWEVAESAEGLLRLRGDALLVGTVESGNFLKREEQWFTTRDRIAVSGNTILPLGRADSMVKVMGELVDLEAVEKRFLEIAGDRVSEKEFVVVALPDLRKEHVLVAVFEGEINGGCVEEYNGQVSGIERLEDTFTVREFPRSSLGKVKRGILLEMCGEK